jgi:hypothetical membrane protein
LNNTREYRLVFLATIIGIILYVVLDAVAQALPPHYSPIRQAESDLAVGPYGYIMAINFVNRGVFSLIFVFGLFKVVEHLTRKFKIGLALLSIWGVGALILAISPTDIGAEVTLHGKVHLLVAFIAFLGGAFGVLFLSLDLSKHPALKSLRRYLLPLGILSTILVFVDFLGSLSRIGGLLERLFLGSVILWILIVSIHLYNSPPLGMKQATRQTGNS